MKNRVKTRIAMFRFTLGTGQSIGPRDLQSLWESACQVENLSVGCAPGPSYADKLTYSLYAPHDLMGLTEVEERLRWLFGERKLRVSLVCAHISHQQQNRRLPGAARPPQRVNANQRS